MSPPTVATVSAPGSVRSQSRWVLFTILAGVAVPILATAIHAARQPYVPSADVALIYLRSLDVPSHLPLTGAYSRYGFDHPGPLLFYVLAIPAHLGGGSGMLFAIGSLNAACAAGCAYVGWRRGGAVLASLTGVAVLVFAHAMGPAIVDPWNPWAPVLPFLLAVMLAWGVLCRDFVLLPWLIPAASFSAQAHISYAPLAGSVVAVSLVFTVWAWRRPRDTDRARPTRTIALATLGLLVLCWAAPLVEQVRHDPGNLTLIARQFLSDHSQEHPVGPFTGTDLPSFDHVLGITAREFGWAPPWTGAAEPIEPFSADVGAAAPGQLLVTFGVFAAVATLGWRRRSHDVVRQALVLQGLVLGLSVLTVASMTRITGGMSAYIVRWTWVPASLLLVSTAWTAWTALTARTSPTIDPVDVLETDPVTELVTGPVDASVTEPSATPDHVQVGALAGPADAAATRTALDERPLARWGLAGVVVIVGTAVALSLWSITVPDQVASDALVRIIGPIEQQLTPGHEVRVLSGGGDALTIRGGLIATLIEDGYPVGLSAEDVHQFGSHRLGTDPNPPEVMVVSGPDLDSFRPRPDQRQIAAFDPLSPGERQELRDLQQRIAIIYVALTSGQPSPERLSPAETARYDDLRGRGSNVAVFLAPAGA